MNKADPKQENCVQLNCLIFGPEPTNTLAERGRDHQKIISQASGLHPAWRRPI